MQYSSNIRLIIAGSKFLMCALVKNFWRQQLFASFNQEIGMEIEQIDFSCNLFTEFVFRPTYFDTGMVWPSFLNYSL